MILTAALSHWLVELGGSVSVSSYTTDTKAF
jgi:hypothetical protein